MAILKQVLKEKIPQWRADAKALVRERGRTEVSRVTVADLFRGLRGVNAVVCDTSTVDPNEGLFIRGIPVNDLLDWPAEALFFLLCTGDRPDESQTAALTAELAERAEIPESVWSVIDNLPDDLHPMTMLSVATLTLQQASVFQPAYAKGVARPDYWEYALEDAMNLAARLPVVAAGIFRRKIRKQPPIAPQPGDGISRNFARMLGLTDPAGHFETFIRRFIAVHCDHEGANASVLAARITGSAQSDLYYCLSTAMNCLSGPIHGRANQESLQFILDIEKRFGPAPDEAALETHIRDLLDAKRIIPGFGHAVLRAPDPRYQALADFGKRLCPECSVFVIAEQLNRIVTRELKRRGKVLNPYANIDGISGVLLHYFGMTETSFYTVMFSVAQALGLCAQLVIESAMLRPIFRPRSVTTAWLRETTGGES